MVTLDNHDGLFFFPTLSFIPKYIAKIQKIDSRIYCIKKRVCLRMLSRNFQKIYNIGEVLGRKNTSKRLEAVSSGILVDSVLGVGQISSPNRICESPRPFSFSLPVDFVSVAKGELSYEQNVQCHLE